MGVWALLFNQDKRFEPRPEHDPQWNRGAYLVEAMGHNITSDAQTGVGAWSEGDLVQYLKQGHADGRGTAAGPMGEAFDDSLRYLTPNDIAAIAAYVRSIPAIATAGLPAPKAVPAPSSYAEGVAASTEPRGAAVYAGACAGCHDWSGVSPVLPDATLTGVRSVNDPAAINVAQIILSGAHRHPSDGATAMPSFGTAYSDEEVASLANYVTARFGAAPSALTAQNIAALRKQD